MHTDKHTDIFPDILAQIESHTDTFPDILAQIESEKHKIKMKYSIPLKSITTCPLMAVAKVQTYKEKGGSRTSFSHITRKDKFTESTT